MLAAIMLPVAFPAVFAPAPFVLFSGNSIRCKPIVAAVRLRDVHALRGRRRGRGRNNWKQDATVARLTSLLPHYML